MERYNDVQKASILGIIGNIFLCIIKSSIGLLSHSQAMIADAFNSASDIFSSLMTFIGNKIASKKADKDHNFGHGKAEYIFSLLISIIMLIVSMVILKDSVRAIFHKTDYEFSKWLVIVCIITIITKLFLYLYTNKIAKKLKNLLVLANSKDHRNDVAITSLNLISCLLTLKNIYFVDGIVGTLISVWILYSALQIFYDSYNVLMDTAIDENTKNRVLNIIKQHKEIEKVQDFKSTPIGYQYQISFSIFVDGNLTTFESHKIADDLEKEIIAKIEEIYSTVIHVNPIEKRNKNEKYNRSKKSNKNI